MIRVELAVACSSVPGKHVPITAGALPGPIGVEAIVVTIVVWGVAIHALIAVVTLVGITRAVSSSMGWRGIVTISVPFVYSNADLAFAPFTPIAPSSINGCCKWRCMSPSYKWIILNFLWFVVEIWIGQRIGQWNVRKSWGVRTCLLALQLPDSEFSRCNFWILDLETPFFGVTILFPRMSYLALEQRFDA